MAHEHFQNLIRFSRSFPVVLDLDPLPQSRATLVMWLMNVFDFGPTPTSNSLA